MKRRYGPTLLSLAWPFLLWVVAWLSVFALESTRDPSAEAFFPTYVVFALAALLAITLIALAYAWKAVRSRADPGVRYTATILNLIPGLAFIWFVLWELTR